MLPGAQKFPPSGEPQHSGTGTPPPLYPSRTAVITEPKPQQRQGDTPLKNTALLLNRTWLLGLNTTRAKSTPKTRDWRQPVMLIFNTLSPPASVQFKDMVFFTGGYGTYLPHPQTLHRQAIKSQWGIQTWCNTLETRLLNDISIFFSVSF